MPTSHPSGWAHADGRPARARTGCASPDDPNALVPHLWSQTAHKVDGVLHVGGARGPRPGRRASTPRRTSSTRPTSGPAPGPSATPSPSYDVYYAGKAFLCTAVARWVAEEGLRLDVCTGGELTVARARRRRPGPDRLPRQQQVVRRAAARGRARASAGSSSTPSTRSSGCEQITGRDRSSGRAGDGPGDRRRRGPHPRVHRDRPRGPEVRVLDHRRRRPRGRTPRARPRRASSCAACTPTSAARSSTPPGSRSRPGGCSRCTRGWPTSSA